MKRIACFMLATALCVSLFGCGQSPAETQIATVAAPTETTAPKYTPIDHVGILVDWWWVIPVGIVVLALLGGGIYMIIGMIVAFRKPGKFDAKKKK